MNQAELSLFLLFLVSVLGGDPWTAPVSWSSNYPSLHLSLDDAEPFTLHNGAQHVVTEV